MTELPNNLLLSNAVITVNEHTVNFPLLFLIVQPVAMATQPLPEDDLSCPVCCDIFVEPVVLLCSHSFCENCLKRYWTDNEHRPCPVCRNVSATDSPPINLALRNLCVSFRESRERRTSVQSNLCGRHGDPLKLFCLEDKSLVCVDCLTGDHKNHKFCSTQEAVQIYKVSLINVMFDMLVNTYGVHLKYKKYIICCTTSQ